MVTASGLYVAYPVSPVDFFIDISACPPSSVYDEPWEVEEMVCIYVFAKEQFNQIFNDIHWDVHQENPRFEGQDRPPTPDGAFDFDSAGEFSLILLSSQLIILTIQSIGNGRRVGMVLIQEIDDSRNLSFRMERQAAWFIHCFLAFN